MAPTTGRWSGAVREPPSASLTRESSVQDTVIHPASATTANPGAFSALIPPTPLAT